MLICIENHAVSILYFQDVMTLLRTGAPDVELLICRPEAGILPALSTALQQPALPVAPADLQPPLQYSTPRSTSASTLEHDTHPQQIHTSKYMSKEYL